MSDKRYEANIIRATAVEPANNLETTSAPGVWSIDEVTELRKKNKWPTVGNVATDVTDVFSNFSYAGNSDTQTIDNGIALADGLGGGTSTEFGPGDRLSKLFSAGQLAADSKTFTFSVWFYWTGAESQTIFDVPVFNVQCNVPAGNILTISGFSDSYATILGFSSTNKVVKNQWNHLLVSMDLSDSSKRHVYLNDASYAGSYNTYSNTNIGFGEAGTTGISSTSATFFGKLAHLFFDTTYRDFSVTSNRRTFIDANGGSTSASTLAALNPPLYFPMTTGYSVGENEGTAGDFTVTGTPTIVSYGTVYQSGYGKGGMVWIKSRTNPGSGHFHHLVDSVRGQSSGFFKAVYTNSNDPENQYPSSTNGGVSSFNSNGFTVAKGSNSNYFLNLTNYEYAAWTFRKQANFFDIIQYTGTGPGSGANEQAVSHNLGTKPGLIMIKKTSGTGDWWMFTDVIDGTNDYVYLNSTNAWNNATSNNVPTDSAFNVGGVLNTSGQTYIAYLWANHNNNGEFGPDGDKDIIKMGTYNGDGQSAGVAVDVGFEPQWIFLRRTDGGGYYTQIIDNMRGMISGEPDNILWPNVDNAENNTLNTVEPTATGFIAKDASNSNLNGSTWFYMAIRRGPLTQPTVATEVFEVDQGDATLNAPQLYAGFPVDMGIFKNKDSTDNWVLSTRITQTRFVNTDSTAAFQGNAVYAFDFQTGWLATTLGTSWFSWMWKRAPGYFDVVAYTGTGSAQTISHNLSAVPEMIWVKQRNDAEDWAVYHSAVANSKRLVLNSTAGETTEDTWNSTTPTSTVFSVGASHKTNKSSGTYLAMLFGTVAGVSKVGSYTGNGSTSGPTIDCGFTSGPKFVLIKRIASTGGWYLFDSLRGIVAGNESQLYLNSNATAQTATDQIDPTSSGFQLVTNSSGINGNGENYIFYAIA